MRRPAVLAFLLPIYATEKLSLKAENIMTKNSSLRLPRASLKPGSAGLWKTPLDYPRTETPEKESTAKPETGWPKRRAGSKRLHKRMFSTCSRVALSVGPATMR